MKITKVKYKSYSKMDLLFLLRNIYREIILTLLTFGIQKRKLYLVCIMILLITFYVCY